MWKRGANIDYNASFIGGGPDDSGEPNTGRA